MHKETLYHIGSEIVVLLVTVVWFQYQNYSLNKRVTQLEELIEELQHQVSSLLDIVKILLKIFF